MFIRTVNRKPPRTKNDLLLLLAYMARRLSEVLSVVWAHPIASCFILILFTPPLFPIVIYFSPLLISTALCVLALISAGPLMAATGEEAGADAKRLKVESLSASLWDAGWSSVRERANKKLRMCNEETAWAESLKGVEGCGRFFLERRSFEESLFSKPTSGETLYSLMDDAKLMTVIAESFDIGEIGGESAADTSDILQTVTAGKHVPTSGYSEGTPQIVDSEEDKVIFPLALPVEENMARTEEYQAASEEKDDGENFRATSIGATMIATDKEVTLDTGRESTVILKLKAKKERGREAGESCAAFWPREGNEEGEDRDKKLQRGDHVAAESEALGSFAGDQDGAQVGARA